MYQHALNGAEVESGDVNLIAEVGALADDHVLAELLRLPPYGGAVSKAILPFERGATVSPNGASGTVLISPFRAIVGSRDTLQNIGPKKLWNDLRSGIFTGVATLTGEASFAANSSGFSRWDLVYAMLATDAAGASVTRFRKDPVSEQVGTVNVVRTRVQRVTVDVLRGTPAVTPAKPALPPDGGGNFYFPLAYVRIPTGFGATSTVLPADIDEVIPYLPLARTTGAATSVPANQCHKEGGTVLSNPLFAWASASGQRPGPYMPPTMAGLETILVPLDLFDANAANWSHPNTGVIDDSRDWRNRVFTWQAHVRGGANTAFAWNGGPPPATMTPQMTLGASLGSRFALGCGQSFWPDMAFNPWSGVVSIDQANATEIAQGARIGLYVDHADAGKLKLWVIGAPAVRLFLWLTATAPYPNAR
jgi:hypothetical protein